MLFILIILGIVSVILLFLLLLQRREMHSISVQIREIGERDTNELVHSNGSGNSSVELINEINSILREMQRSRIDYQQKNHALEQMMTNISHDLRTPLTSAMGYIHIIQNSDLNEDEKNRELAVIEKRLIRLEELINSFFEFSQIVSSGRKPEKTEINLVSVLEESIVHYYDDYCGQDRKIIFRCEQHKLAIKSNRNMLLRIFDNLIGNALKHGKSDMCISVDVTDKVRIIFENELGSSEIDIEHIFEEFYTTDISRTKGNTGLGLAIAKQFTEILGGNISANLIENQFQVTVTLH